MSRVATGLDRVAASDDEALSLLRGRRVGLVAHPASVDGRLRHARRVLADAGVEVRAIFGPEHGYGGGAQDMIGVGASREPETGVPIYSLYGAREEDLTPSPEALEGLDALVVDLQDVGSRYYTYVWTAALALKAAAAQGIETVVLDRPNPLGGVMVEGAPQRTSYQSFVGLYDVAVRHGMTLGEMCGWVRRVEGIDEAALHVVSMRGWERVMGFEDTGLPWVFPSPNMPTPDTARVYPGGCLLEGTNLSEGRGHTRPFEVWGAPFVDGHALARDVAIEGAFLRPLTFEPTFHKHARTRCGGVQVHVLDVHRFRPYETYLRLIAAVRARAPESFAWRTDAYEFVRDRVAIDLLTGGPEAREAIDGGASLEPVLEAESRGAAAFAEARRAVLLYA